MKLLRPWGAAVRQGMRAARQNYPAFLGLQSVMVALVVFYYLWPAGQAVLSNYAVWQHRGGMLGCALATSLAGGFLSEIAQVYFQEHGQWRRRNLESMTFKAMMFFGSGAIVYEFYQYQAVWFGQSTGWRVVLRKVLVDQFVFTVFWSTPYQTLLTRWQALGYSGSRLRSEWGWKFLEERVLPVMVTNWMFWLPSVLLIYSMPLLLQSPLFIFATATWGLLLAAVAQAEPVPSVSPILVEREGPASN